MIISYNCTMCFDQIYFHSLSSNLSHPVFLPPNLMHYFVFNSLITQCCQCVHGSRPIHRSVANLRGPHPKENWLSPPRSHQLAVCLFNCFGHTGIFPSLILYRSWMTSHSRCGLRSGKYSLVADLCTHCLWRPFCSFSYDNPRALARENMTYNGSLEAEHSTSSYSLHVLNICINHNHRERSHSDDGGELH